MTLTAGNLRNGGSASVPKFMESVDGTKQYGVLIRADWGITVWRRVLPTVGHTADDRWTYYDLSLDPDAIAVGLDYINPVDDHWDVGIGVDDQNRLHVVGNSHQNLVWEGISSLRYVRSGADDITDWHPGISGAYPFSSTGVNNHTYNQFERLADGTLLWFMSQGEAIGSSLGRDWIWTHLPPGSGTTWKVPGNPSTTGAAHLAISETDTSGTVANRVYVNGVFVVPAGWYGNTAQELHVHGIWRTLDEDATSQQQPFYFYSDNIALSIATAGSHWRVAGGAAMTGFPLTWFNRATAQVTTAPSRSTNGSPCMVLDHFGQPHMLYRNGVGATDFVRCWYSKSAAAWQSDPLLSGSDPLDPQDWSAGGAMARVRNDLFFLASYGNRVKVHNLGSVNDHFSFVMGGPATNGYHALPEPCALRRHTVSVMIPNGDTPAVYDFGNGYRASAET